jgi:hypothetical protein
MTLQDVLRRHGIATSREFSRRVRPALSRQQIWNLWWGYSGIGKKTALLLSERLGIPTDELLRVKAVPHSARPRKRPPEPPPAS